MQVLQVQASAAAAGAEQEQDEAVGVVPEQAEMAPFEALQKDESKRVDQALARPCQVRVCGWPHE